MIATKLFELPEQVTPENFEDVMVQAITLELATIPTYLSTYYSINRAQNQDVLYAKILAQLKAASLNSEIDFSSLAQELKLDVLLYSNKSAALVMSVVIEEMLHLALASNVKQAICQIPPDLMAIGKVLSFPTQLDGHIPEFQINAAKLSLEQLTTFLQIESPEPFVDPNSPPLMRSIVKYQTIGKLYDQIIECIKEHFPGPYTQQPQLLPPEPKAPPRPFYGQNSSNTVHYDKDHNPIFANADDSGGLVGVYDSVSAIEALGRIQEQGEGKSKDNQHILEWGPDKMPVPMPVVDGKVEFWEGDYDDSGKELAHFAKFLEAYSLGGYYQKKFKGIAGLDDFFSYFVYDTAANATQADYDHSGNNALALCNKLGNATFAYILLMIETCYYKDESTQFDLFMYGIHKSMIWLLSGVGNQIKDYNYTKDGKAYRGSVTWEHYPFEDKPGISPKQQLIDLMTSLAKADSTNWGWAIKAEYANYWPALPDVSLDHNVGPNVPNIPLKNN